MIEKVVGERASRDRLVGDGAEYSLISYWPDGTPGIPIVTSPAQPTRPDSKASGSADAGSVGRASPMATLPPKSVRNATSRFMPAWASLTTAVTELARPAQVVSSGTQNPRVMQS